MFIYTLQFLSEEQEREGGGKEGEGVREIEKGKEERKKETKKRKEKNKVFLKFLTWLLGRRTNPRGYHIWL